MCFGFSHHQIQFIDVIRGGLYDAPRIAALFGGYVRKLLKDSLPAGCRVFLYGSRARDDNRWNSDCDLWSDAELPRAVLRDLGERLEESSISFRIDLVTTPDLAGKFADQVKKEAVPWMSA